MDGPCPKASIRDRFFNFALLAGSVAYFTVCFLLRGARRLLGRRVPGTAVILCYHAVPEKDRSRFARQMDDLLRWARPIPADFRDTLADGTHHVAVTFDDGYQSVIDHALPELRKRNIPATIFLPTGNLGRAPAWKMPDSSPLHQERISPEEFWPTLSPDEMAIGSHTVSHPRLGSLGDDAAREELVESRAALEALLGREVTTLALPHGSHTSRTIELCREAGYARVFSIFPARAFGAPGEFVTPRAVVNPSDSPLKFRMRMFGAYHWMRATRHVKRRLSKRQRQTAGESPQ